MNHLSPGEALKLYRRVSPDFVVENAQRFREMDHKDQMELLFYMLVYQANALGEIGQAVNIDIHEIPQPGRDN